MSKSVIGVFVPQAWINHYAVEIDGRVSFDCTEAIALLGESISREIKDNSYGSDDLVPDEIRDSHSGPFYVEVEQSIADYFDSLMTNVVSHIADAEKAASSVSPISLTSKQLVVQGSIVTKYINPGLTGDVDEDL